MMLRKEPMVRRLILVALICCGLSAVQAAAAEPEVRPLIVGHRGLVQSAPENTLAAFRACLALKVGFEFDIRRTKDGQLVCLHDDTVQRTTNGKGRLADLAAADVLRLDAGERFDPAFRGEPIPTVDEIFALLAKQWSSATLIAVDLKEAGNGIEEGVVRQAQKHDVLGRLVFIGLTIESPEFRARLRAANPQAQTARLAATPGNVEEVLVDKHADWVYVRFLPELEQVHRIHARGKRLFLAGPLVAGNEPESWKKAAVAGIDAVLTDFPIEMQRLFRQASKVSP
jgi:glycerophosphoryl diester phosphodiesterase